MAISALPNTPRCAVRLSPSPSPSPVVVVAPPAEAEVEAQAAAAVAAAQYLDPAAPLEVQAADPPPAKARVNLAVVRNHLARTDPTAIVRIMMLR